MVTTQPTPLDADKIYDDICTPPQDAKYEERGGKGYIVKAQNGIGIDKEMLRKTIEENSENEFNYYVPLEILTPMSPRCLTIIYSPKSLVHILQSLRISPAEG